MPHLLGIFEQNGRRLTVDQEKLRTAVEKVLARPTKKMTFGPFTLDVVTEDFLSVPIKDKTP